MLQQIFSEPFGKFTDIMIERNSLGVKEIPALFLLSLTVGRFSIFPVSYTYVLEVHITFGSPLNFNATTQSCLFFLTVSPEPYFRDPPPNTCCSFTLMPCLFQLLLITYFMPPLELSLPILIIQKNPQTLLRHLHWLVLIFDIKLKLCLLSAGLCMVYSLPASMHLSFLLYAHFYVTLTSSILKKI